MSATSTLPAPANEIYESPGARAWRRILTVEGVKAGAGLDVIDRALDAVRSGLEAQHMAIAQHMGGGGLEVQQPAYGGGRLLLDDLFHVEADRPYFLIFQFPDL